MQPTFEGPTFAGVALRLEWVERAVALVTLTRQAQMNTLSHELLAEFGQVLDMIDVPSTRALIVTGQDRAFCCGAHLRYFAGDDASIFEPFDSRDPYFARIAVLFDRLEELAFPTIAAVNGSAVGAGMNLALAAGVIVLLVAFALPLWRMATVGGGAAAGAPAGVFGRAGWVAVRSIGCAARGAVLVAGGAE